MITALIKYKNNSLTAPFPIEAGRLADCLGSIGIRSSAEIIPAKGNEQISIKLFGDEEMGNILIERLNEQDSLSEMNETCKNLNRLYPYGFDEFLKHLGQTQSMGTKAVTGEAMAFYLKDKVSMMDNSVLFSYVELTNPDNESVEFWESGIVSKDTLEYSDAYYDFCKQLDGESVVMAEIQSYSMGSGESEDINSDLLKYLPATFDRLVQMQEVDYVCTDRFTLITEPELGFNCTSDDEEDMEDYR